MADERRCAEVAARLERALLDREEPEAEIRTHAEACGVCGPLLRELAALRSELDALRVVPDVPEPLASATLTSARSLLASGTTVAAPVAGGLPEGFSRECLRLLGAALLPLPLVVAWNVAFMALGERLLEGLVPAAMLAALGVAYVAAAAGWSALVYGSIPILAHRCARRRTAEVTP